MTQKIPFLFLPGKAVEVPDDVSIQSWVDVGHIVQIADHTGDKVEAKVEEKPVVQKEPKADKPKVAEPKADKPKYEETEDGGFKCLLCDKSYKASFRAETLIKQHIEKEHS